MQVQEIISKKRDGGENSNEELSFLIHGYISGEIKDYQMSAWLMAVFFRGLSAGELSEWTRLKWKSGETFPRSNRNDYWIDKHSTGGVGDKTSLILVPLVTAVAQRLFGKGKVRIPMVSGRGLAHSGGTLDKLESVPGFSPNLTIQKAMKLLEANDSFMMGQTKEFAPADRLIYALRDVTGTVESLPLIVSSIMSKKLSENLDGIVFDVKTGGGAFMKTEDDSRRLARALNDVAKAQKVDAIALVTRMDEPLGTAIGNLLEVIECWDYLKGEKREKGLHEVVIALASSMLHLGSRKKLSLKEAEGECEKELKGKQPSELFVKMFEAQGGKWKSFEKERSSLTKNCQVLEWKAKLHGFVTEIKAKELGLLLNDLGGGRRVTDDVIDPKVGMEVLKKVGDAVVPGDTIMKVYFTKDAHQGVIQKVLEKAVTVGTQAVKAPSWIVETIK